MTEEEFKKYNEWLEDPYLENNSLSVIVTSYHTVDYTIKLLESLKENILKMPNINTEVLLYEDHRENDLLQKYVENINLKNWHYFAVPEELSTNNPVYGRNEGIKKATGNYLTFLDGDDLLTDKAWQCYIKGIELLEKDKKANISQFLTYRLLDNETNRQLNFKNPEVFKNIPIYCIDKIKNNFNIYVGDANIKHSINTCWNKIYRTKSIKQLSFFDISSEDLAFNLECYAKNWWLKAINIVGYIHFVGTPTHLGERFNKNPKYDSIESFIKNNYEKIKNSTNFLKKQFIKKFIIPYYLYLLNNSKEEKKFQEFSKFIIEKLDFIKTFRIEELV